MKDYKVGTNSPFVFLGRDEEKEVQGLLPSAAGSNCVWKGRAFTKPFDGGWGMQVNGVNETVEPIFVIDFVL